ncbi:hypothetical protein CK502_08500 [Klebsiella pneumoniae]|nr:hypothetical protein CK502_08500 [Klebsiella pneumoniae]
MGWPDCWWPANRHANCWRNSSGAGRTSDGNGSHASTLKSPSYTKSVSWQHYQNPGSLRRQYQRRYWRSASAPFQRVAE